MLMVDVTKLDSPLYAAGAIKNRTFSVLRLKAVQGEQTWLQFCVCLFCVCCSVSLC